MRISRSPLLTFPLQLKHGGFSYKIASYIPIVKIRVLRRNLIRIFFNNFESLLFCRIIYPGYAEKRKLKSTVGYMETSDGIPSKKPVKQM